MKGILEYWKNGILELNLIPSFHFSILPFFIFYFLFSISLSAQFIITSSTTPVTCPGGSDGTAAVSVAGGSPPYIYLWSNGNTTSNIQHLISNIYSVTITDNGGTDSTIFLTVSQPQPISDKPQILCSITLAPAGGTSPYSFKWNDGSTNFFINAGTGNYSVIITDANNCTANFSYIAECSVSPEPFFTPNNDNINDVWYVANSQYFPNAKVIVFDRWGTRVWEHKGLYESWDGKSYLGIPVPDAVYYYFFYQDKDDKQKQAKTGSVTILR